VASAVCSFTRGIPERSTDEILAIRFPMHALGTVQLEHGGDPERPF